MAQFKFAAMIFFLLLVMAFPCVSAANKVIKYKGVAKDGDRTAYIEKHTVTYSDAGELLQGVTEYVSDSGKPLAELKSDFTTSLTVPTHETRDFRSGDVQGVRREGSKVVLYYKDKDQPEKSRILASDDSDGRILIGCQGVNYYLLGKLNSLEPEIVFPLRFLIPGKLDYYDFDMKPVGTPTGSLIDFEIKVKNWILKLFAPTLYVQYDRNKRRIVKYDGISNIRGDDGKDQKVKIEYIYEGD